ncbi:MAG: S8 family serine peptidase [Bacteroidetes bacterium]|nr:S8 family serine peptidase [Bacteroidota bacterium]
MKVKRILVLLLFVLLFINAKAQFRDDVIYLKIKDSSSVVLEPYDNLNIALNSAIILYGIDSIYRPFPELNNTMNKTYRVHFTQTAKIDLLISTLAQIPFIEYAEKAPVYSIDFTPNDYQSSQWYLDKIRAKDAWDVQKGKSSVIVAVVDNAVRLSHEDIKANLWTNPSEIAGNGIDDDLNGYVDDVHGADVSDGDGNPNPPQPIAVDSPFVHGTLCAGAVSATTDNNIGIASLGFGLRIMAVKCTPDNASDHGESVYDGYDGIYYAIRNGADVISLSWGGPSGNLTTGLNLISSARQAGIVVVAAAGNSNTDQTFYPAGYNGVIGVGASDRDDKRASFSNFGSYVDIMAPGVGIQTTNGAADNAYSYPGGTSLACPLVASLCGLLKSQNPSFSPSQIEQKVFDGADNIDSLNPGYSGKLGHGRMNAANSLGASVSVEEIESRYAFPTLWKSGTHISLYAFTGQNLRLISMKGEVISLNTSIENTSDFLVPVDLSAGMYVFAFEVNAQLMYVRVMVF